MTILAGERRVRLAELLAEAAELEHNVCCQYLYAGFSLKKNPDEGGITWPQLEKMRVWGATIMMIARQEMEHLALVCNLQTAIGEAPELRRPDYPLSTNYYTLNVPSILEAFNPAAIARFVLFEKPAEPDPERWSRFLQLASELGLDASPNDTIGALYAEIRRLFTELDEKELFVGPIGAQFCTTDIIPVPLRGIQLPPTARIYDIMVSPVTNRASAIAAIDQIIQEGEGSPNDRTDSHFGMFVQMLDELAAEQKKDPGFAPARPVVKNSRTKGDDDGPIPDGATLITNPDTNLVSQLFDVVYTTMLMMLMRYFGHSDQTEEQEQSLQQAAFFPLMTAAIRPLGETLTLLPAFLEPPSPTAGPSFACGRRPAQLPHREAAWKVLSMQLQLATDLANKVQASPVYPGPIQERLELVYENLARVNLMFDLNMGRAARSERLYVRLRG